MKSLQLNKPHAIMVVGLPGSGKSHFAEKFSETFNAPFVDARKIRDNSRDEKSGRDLLKTFLTEITKTRQTFIFEPIQGSRKSRTDFVRWAKQAGYETLVVWVQVDNQTATKRSKSLGRSTDEHQETAKSFSEPHTTENASVISGKHTYASQAKVILTRLSSVRAEQPSVKMPPQRPRSIDISRM